MFTPVLVFGMLMTPKIPTHYSSPPVAHSAPARVKQPTSAGVNITYPGGTGPGGTVLPKTSGKSGEVVPDAAPTSVTPPGYLGDIAGGGYSNPCNFTSGYQYGVCNPTGETPQQYAANPAGPAPGTPTNSQGCYYVRMDEGYCPSTGTTVPMQDPNG